MRALIKIISAITIVTTAIIPPVGLAVAILTIPLVLWLDWIIKNDEGNSEQVGE
jgi:hypothetical protein